MNKDVLESQNLLFQCPHYLSPAKDEVVSVIFLCHDQMAANLDHTFTKKNAEGQLTESTVTIYVEPS